MILLKLVEYIIDLFNIDLLEFISNLNLLR